MSTRPTGGGLRLHRLRKVHFRYSIESLRAICIRSSVLVDSVITCNRRITFHALTRRRSIVAPVHFLHTGDLAKMLQVLNFQKCNSCQVTNLRKQNDLIASIHICLVQRTVKIREVHFFVLPIQSQPDCFVQLSH